MKKESTEAGAIRQQADDALWEIADLKATIKSEAAKCAAEQQKIIDKYTADIAAFETMLEGCEKSLLSLLKANKATLWGAEATNLKLFTAPHSEIVYLENGELRYEVSTPVALPKSHEALIATLENLGAGYAEAIKVKKSLDKDQVNAWPDDKLTVAGLTRKGPKEAFDFTL
jgi:phage host-nuclease inhibitor protein Gam